MQRTLHVPLSIHSIHTSDGDHDCDDDNNNNNTCANDAYVDYSLHDTICADRAKRSRDRIQIVWKVACFYIHFVCVAPKTIGSLVRSFVCAFSFRSFLFANAVRGAL